MKRFSVLSIALFFACAVSFAQPMPGQLRSGSLAAPVMHYQEEYTFDTVVDAKKWNSVKPGLNVSFATTDQLYFRREVPSIQATQTLEQTVWKGERLNAQVLVYTKDTIEQVRFVLNDLAGPNGKKILKNNMQLDLVRYVVSNYPYAAKDVTCGESPYKNLYLMPDRFEPFDRFEVPGNSLRPVWLTINVPQNVDAGTYNGNLDVIANGVKTTLTVKLRVQDQVLPAPKDWKHRLDLWQNPVVLARRNNLEPWSAEHRALLKQHLKLYADAGGKFITTYAVHSPWSDNSYMIEETMIEWIKDKSGKFRFDYTMFDDYVQLAMDAGVTDAITVYTPIPWGNRFRFMNEATGEYEYPSWNPETDSFKVVWNVFLTDLRAHLQKKKWLDKTYLGINENEMKQTLAAIQVIRAHSKDWKITYAGNWHKELDQLLDDYCYLYGQESTKEVIKDRASKGMTTTYYVCCNPPVPNNFVFSPPIEGRWISWYTAAMGYDGFLRWAYDAWPADPNRDARHTLWPAGDCFLVYPGGKSGIRYEKLREGIVDFEKIQMLKKKAQSSNDKEVKALWQQLEQHLVTFTKEKDFNTDKIIKDVDTGKDLVIQLSDKLGKKGF